MRRRSMTGLLMAVASVGVCILVWVTWSEAPGTDAGSVEDQHASRRLSAPNGSRDDRMGESVALSRSYALLGAPLAASPFPASGAAYLYEKTSENEWTYLGKLFPDQSAAGSVFGSSVALYGSTALVGAPGNNSSGRKVSGAAYIFHFDTDGTWKQVAKLVASDAMANDNFGTSVALSKHLAVIGAPQRSEGGSAAAYVFQLNGNSTWKEIAKLTPDDPASDNGFGNSLAIDEQTVVVGGIRDRPEATAVGAAYVFRRDRLECWRQVAKLTAGGASAGFSASLALQGDTLVVGSCFDSSKKIFAGAAYVYRRDESGSWGLVTKLTASNAAANDLFGRSVAVSGNTVVVGAIRPKTAGAVYVFKSHEAAIWKQTAAYAANDTSAGDLLGSAVAISDDAVLAGAPQHDAPAPNSGSVYVFRIGAPR